MMKRRFFLAALVAAFSLFATDGFVSPTGPALAQERDLENTLYIDLEDGRVTIEMRPDLAPNHVARIKELAREGFYDGVVFHRVIDGFMAQTGDPTGTGRGGSDKPDLEAEFSDANHGRGAVSMARAQSPNSANSQFFIVFYPRFALDKKYTVFGRVISGMGIVDAIERGEPPANPTKILQASVATDGKGPPPPPPPPVIVDDAAISVTDLDNSVSDTVDLEAPVSD